MDFVLLFDFETEIFKGGLPSDDSFCWTLKVVKRKSSYRFSKAASPPITFLTSSLSTASDIQTECTPLTQSESWRALLPKARAAAKILTFVFARIFRFARINNRPCRATFESFPSLSQM